MNVFIFFVWFKPSRKRWEGGFVLDGGTGTGPEVDTSGTVADWGFSGL